MPTPTKGPRIGASAKHERMILAGLASQLFEHGKIKTTAVRAKRVQPLAERLISKAKRGDLHARRQVLSQITDPGVVHVLFTEIAPMMEGRDGGYTRVTRVGNRKGDNAPLAVIELVKEKVAEKKPAAKSEPVEAEKTEAEETAAVDQEASEVESVEDSDPTTDAVEVEDKTEEKESAETDEDAQAESEAK